VKPSSALKMVRELEAGACDVQRQGGPQPHRGGPEARGGAELNQEFFLLIGLTPEEAFREAEKLEHIVSPEVVRRIAELNEALKKMRGF